MVSIGRIPRKTQGFFKGIAGHFSARAFRHFWGLVLAMTISHGSTIDRLARLLRGSTHRTNHGEFLWRSDWSESDVLQQVALETLRRLHRKNARPCYLIIDETQTLKRAKKMSGVRKLYHHATGQYGTGHTMVTELLIQDEKQQLGLGDYRVLRYRAVVRHLHLVDIAYACLTRLALTGRDEQGQRKNDKVLRLPPISQLKARMRQIVWQEALEDVVKHSHEKPVLRRLERLLAA